MGLGRRGFTILAAGAVLLPMLALAPGSAAAAARQLDVAPGAPGAPSYFDLARKDCVGTAANTRSKVWYTVADGVLSDVYEPTIDNTNVSTLQYIVTDGSTFTDLQTRDMTYTVSADPTGMACTVTATDSQHGYQLITTYITDPASDTVLMNTRLAALPGSGTNVAGLHLYARLDAHVNGNGGGGSDNAGGNTGVVDTSTGSPVPVISSTNTVTNAVNRDYAVPTYMALDASVSSPAASVGYAGSASDGLTQLDLDHSLTSYDSAPDGHITATEDVTPAPGRSVTLALGFGRDQASAVATAWRSLRQPFLTAELRYLHGWLRYDARLRPPFGHLSGAAARRDSGAILHYYLSANVIKASVDKTFPGAIVASLASPWGQSVPAGVFANGQPSYFGSYREVFARDLYEAFTGLLVDGDLATARAATLFLFDRQQQADGSMPRNSLLNGKTAPDTGGTQLDETSYPIIMALQAGLGGSGSLWRNHIRPAADFLVSHGPSIGVERWEEQTGYSPSTIAAEIAGLTAAAVIAGEHGDQARARVYQATADDFQRNIKSWTVTTSGPYAPSYFIRLSKTGDPNAAISYSLGNGGPTLDQRDVVDGGFQELVRLGELPVSDPDVQASLGVWDKQIAVSTPSGTGYYRYGNSAAQGSADGYGDCYQPSQTSCSTVGAPWAPTGTGTGHLWPVLSGERAESDVAEGNLSGAASLLTAMENFSSGVGLVPEQAWEDPDLPGFPVRQRPGDRVHWLHRRAGGRVSLAADLGAGPGTAADPGHSHRPHRGNAPVHHAAVRGTWAARRAEHDDHRTGQRQHARGDVHDRDRDHHAACEGDHRVAGHHQRGTGLGDVHGGRLGRIVLRDGADRVRQQRDHRRRQHARVAEHRLRTGDRQQRGRRQHGARRHRPHRRRQWARHLPVPHRLGVPARRVRSDQVPGTQRRHHRLLAGHGGQPGRDVRRGRRGAVAGRVRAHARGHEHLHGGGVPATQLHDRLIGGMEPAAGGAGFRVAGVAGRVRQLGGDRTGPHVAVRRDHYDRAARGAVRYARPGVGVHRGADRAGRVQSRSGARLRPDAAAVPVRRLRAQRDRTDLLGGPIHRAQGRGRHHACGRVPGHRTRPDSRPGGHPAGHRALTGGAPVPRP